MPPKPNASRAIRSDIVQGIREGRWAAGVRLPSARSLAGHYGVSHVTVAAAMNRLVEEGYIVKRHGSGAFVADTPPVSMSVRIAYPQHIPQPLRASFERLQQAMPEVQLFDRLEIQDCDVCLLDGRMLSHRRLREQLLPVSEWPQLPDVGDMHPFLLSAASVSDTLYAIPFHFSPSVLIYNADLLGKAGADIASWTCHDLLEHVQALHKKLGKKGIRAFNHHEQFRVQVMPLLPSFGGGLCAPDGSRSTLTDPETLAGLTYCAELVRSMPGFQPGELSNRPDLVAGHLAIRAIDLYNYSELYRKNAALKVAPIPRGTRSGGMYTGMWLGIPSRCRDVARAAAAIEFLCGPSEQLEMARVGHLFPARRAAATAALKQYSPSVTAAYEQICRRPVGVPRVEPDDLNFIDAKMRDWWHEGALDAKLSDVHDMLNARLYQPRSDTAGGDEDQLL